MPQSRLFFPDKTETGKELLGGSVKIINFLYMKNRIVKGTGTPDQSLYHSGSDTLMLFVRSDHNGDIFRRKRHIAYRCKGTVYLLFNKIQFTDLALVGVHSLNFRQTVGAWASIDHEKGGFVLIPAQGRAVVSIIFFSRRAAQMGMISGCSDIRVSIFPP